jgi:hypothetical protein
MLFNIYINYLPMASNDGSLKSYVDDSKIVLPFFVNEVNSAVVKLNEDLRRVASWCSLNSLLIKFIKTYLNANSFHPKSQILGIAKVVALRLCRICSKDEDFKPKVTNMPVKASIIFQRNIHHMLGTGVCNFFILFYFNSHWGDTNFVSNKT